MWRDTSRHSLWTSPARCEPAGWTLSGESPDRPYGEFAWPKPLVALKAHLSLGYQASPFFAAFRSTVRLDCIGNLLTRQVDTRRFRFIPFRP